MNKTPRRVSVYIGRPPGLKDEEGQEEGQPFSPDECFSVDFMEEGGDEGFTAQTVCLCTLNAATEAWLTGKSDDEVMEIFASHPGGDHVEPGG
jgi:hypothetical protein